MLGIVRIGSKNFDRQCRRMYNEATIIMKLEERFGVLGERAEKIRRHFPKEEKYVPTDWENTWDTTKEYRDKMMSKNDAFYSNMSPIFKIFWWLSWALVSLIFVLILLHLTGYFVSSFP